MPENNIFELIKRGFGYRALTFLYNNRDKKVYGSLIAKSIVMAEANISPVLKKLEQLKLVKKEIDAKNKRVKYVVLTDTGLELARLFAQIDNILNNLGPKKKPK